jgi:hypothetical protein
VADAGVCDLDQHLALARRRDVISTICKGLPASKATAARDFIKAPIG